MTQQSSTRNMVLTSLLTALAILIPLIMPIKLVIGPASYTLASHVPTMMAMFRSPAVAAIVALGSTVGFFVSGVPIIIVFRALTHVIFATIGAYYLQHHRTALVKTSSRFLFSLLVNLIHALAEVVVVYLFVGLGTPFTMDLFTLLVVFVGIGSVIHGMVDFELSYQFTKALDNRARVKFAQIEL
ncbi:hypothetical protein ACF3NG_02060 [Aerococcaceae bacterium WGS1372]